MLRVITADISYSIEKHFNHFDKALKGTLSYLFNDDEWWSEKKEYIEYGGNELWTKKINPSHISNLNIEVKELGLGKVSVIFKFLCSDDATYEEFKLRLPRSHEFNSVCAIDEELRSDLLYGLDEDDVDDIDESLKISRELIDIIELDDYSWEVNFKDASGPF